MKKSMLIAAVLVILVVAAVPVLAMAQPSSKTTEQLVEALGFADAGEFLAFFGLEEDDGKGDYADSSGSIDADALAEQLDYSNGDDLAREFGFSNEEELEERLEGSGDLNEFAQALGYADARELARDLGLNRGELATVLGFEDDDDGTDEAASTADVAGIGGSDGGGSGTALSSEVEQEAESGDVSMSAEVASSGDSSNQCAPVLQAANTGNVQNAQIINQYASQAEDIEVEGGSISISPELVARCQQEVQQAAAAGGNTK